MNALKKIGRVIMAILGKIMDHVLLMGHLRKKNMQGLCQITAKNITNKL